MSNLISGKEAKLAWAKDENVWYQNGDSALFKLSDTDFYSSIFLNYRYKFYIKPRTITINSIEVPAPFKAEEGDQAWYLHSHSAVGYSNGVLCGDYTHLFQYGAWRTEEEIKQVVAALRTVFGGKS